MEKEEKELLEKLRTLKEEISQDLDSNLVQIEDIIYNGTVELIPKDEEKEPLEKELYVLIKRVKDEREYEIYLDGELIASQNEDGILKFNEVLERYSNKEVIFSRLLDRENKISRSKLEEKAKEEQNKKEKVKQEDKQEETEEQVIEKTAQTMGVDLEEIQSCTKIDPTTKVTNKTNFNSMFKELIGKEADDCKNIIVAYMRDDSNPEGSFVFLKEMKDGRCLLMESIEKVPGTTTEEQVKQINEDGSELEERTVKGLVIPKKNKSQVFNENNNYGFSIEVGPSGKIQLNYVSNILGKKEDRIQIRIESTSQKPVDYQVKEYMAQDSDELKKEAAKMEQMQGNNMDNGTVNLDVQADITEEVKQAALEVYDNLSSQELNEFIIEQIEQRQIQISEQEKENLAEEIRSQVEDEARITRERNF